VNRWEIWTCDFPVAGPHPAIIISHPDRVAKCDFVNVLLCSTKRATRPANETEMLLDEADGLDWPTLCKCDVLYLVPKEKLYRRRGSVTWERRRAILQKVISSISLNLP